jgi:hypothetical protein
MLKTLIPLIESIVALVLTGYGSWDCQYFTGATISFTSSHYGLWTLQDASGKCQLWDQMFSAYDLGPMLRTARFFSMVAQLDGLALTAVLSQAIQFHACSWAIFLALFFLFLTSMFASGEKRRSCYLYNGSVSGSIAKWYLHRQVVLIPPGMSIVRFVVIILFIFTIVKGQL